jgi:1-acyl-sn-glycerol-3-phosphate acyltransferase
VKLPPTAVRRWVIDPLWPLLAVVLAAVFLLVAVVGGLSWPVTRRARAGRLALLAAYYLILNTGLLLGCAGLWLAHPVAARRDRERWRQAHTALLRRVLSALRRASGPLLGFRVRLEEPPGGPRMDPGPLLILARHAGPGDSFTLADLLLSRYHRTPRIVLKETLQWDPGLDLILNRLGACFLPPHAGSGEALTNRLADLARSLIPGDAMLIFPEGRNWTPRRYQRAIARLRRLASRRAAGRVGAVLQPVAPAAEPVVLDAAQAARDAEQNPHVLPPRPGGVLAALAARPDLGVIVIAHTGLEDLVSPGQVWAALPLYERPMTIRWWYLAPGTVPPDPAEQYQWLRVQWALVDSWIGARIARSGVPDLAEEIAADVAAGIAADESDRAGEGLAAASADLAEAALPGQEPSPGGDPILDPPG